MYTLRYRPAAPTSGVFFNKPAILSKRFPLGLRLVFPSLTSVAFKALCADAQFPLFLRLWVCFQDAGGAVEAELFAAFTRKAFVTRRRTIFPVKRGSADATPT